MKFIKRHWNYFKDNAVVSINMAYRWYTVIWLAEVALVATLILYKITLH